MTALGGELADYAELDISALAEVRFRAEIGRAIQVAWATVTTAMFGEPVEPLDLAGLDLEYPPLAGAAPAPVDPAISSTG